MVFLSSIYICEVRRIVDSCSTYLGSLALRKMESDLKKIKKNFMQKGQPMIWNMCKVVNLIRTNCYMKLHSQAIES